MRENRYRQFIYKYFNLARFLRVLPVISCILLFSICNSYAQSHLSRVSNTARSDGMGYVVRYHLSAAVDSFDLLQPAPDFVQMVLYGNNIDTTGIVFPEQSEKLQEVRLYDLGYGYGVDIYLSNTAFYRSEAYLDKNGHDILLALTEATQEEVQLFAQQFIARNWYDEIIPENALDVSGPSPEFGNDYKIIKKKLRFDRVVINPGHGEWDPGSIGYKGVQEKDITLQVSLKLGKIIEENLPDVDVIYTRDNDRYTGLAELGHIANESQGDLFISIHTNSYTNKYVHGTEVYFLGLSKSDQAFEVMKRENSVFKHEIDQELSEEDLLVYELANSGYLSVSEKIAYMIDDQFRNRAKRKSRGVKQAPFQVLYEASMPAVLVELGFITNPSEQRYLTSERGQILLASAIYRAIKEYKMEYERAQAYNKSY